MATHTLHNPIADAGLADGCERCAEIAINPFANLDRADLANLVERTRAWMDDREMPRSDNELRAMKEVEFVLVRVRAMRRMGLEA